MIAPPPLRGRGSASNPKNRFESIERGTARPGLPPLEIELWVGDNIQDFPNLTQDIRKQPDSAFAKFGDDFGGDEETIIANSFEKPVMISRYPAAIKAFYMEPDPGRPEVALCVDVLAPEGYGEVIGGGERATSLQFLQEQIAAHGLPEDAFQWYLDLRRYGSVPHAGFGMGIERCTAWMCGIEHIRETIPFPRMLYRLRP